MSTKPGGAYIDNLPDSAEGTGYYELPSTRDEYLALHFPGADPLKDVLGVSAPAREERYPFAVRRLWPASPGGDALDVGAACGRVTFDLAADHAAAWGIDLSHSLVAAAREVQATGRARYRTVVEGDVCRDWDVAVETAPNARFAVANALDLPFPDARFATVVALNLVDRVPDPIRALDELGRVTAPGGTLLVGSPYTWLDSFTPRARWLGGFRRDGAPVRGADAVRAHLSPAFTFVREDEMPFFIAHHARSGQLGLAHIQAFVRKS
ncbi:MAG: methyltransferase domain-containing protein [Planctomycetota bacterium]|jgi:SAM-dependent methyltransferase